MKFFDINGTEREYDVWYSFVYPWPFLSYGLNVLPVNPPEAYALQLLYPGGIVKWWHPWVQDRRVATHWRLKSWDWFDI
jgi:hypothetical protein